MSQIAPRALNTAKVSPPPRIVVELLPMRFSSFQLHMFNIPVFKNVKTYVMTAGCWRFLAEQFMNYASRQNFMFGLGLNLQANISANHHETFKGLQN